jgi:hypothetical protein
LQYPKEIDKKVHKMHKSMVNVLSNLNMAMCHAFIEDWNLMPPPIHLFKYDEDEQLVVNNQYT